MDPLFTIESDYEYVLGEIQGKAMTFQMQFMDSAPLHQKLDELAQVIEATAKGLVSGFIKSGNLYRGIRAYTARTSSKEAVVMIESNAVNEQGQYYGGHIEYGYHPYGGTGFVPARPYMRPAMEIATASTHVDLAAAIGQTFEEVFAYDRAQGLTTMLGNRAARYGEYGRYRSTTGRFLSKQDKKTLRNMDNHFSKNSKLRENWENSRKSYSFERGKTYVGSKSQGGFSKWNSAGRATSSIKQIDKRTINNL